MWRSISARRHSVELRPQAPQMIGCRKMTLWWHRKLLQELGWQGCCQDGAVFVLVHPERADQFEQGGIGLIAWFYLLERLEEIDQGGEVLGSARCVGLGGGDLLDAEAERTRVTEAGDEGCVLRQGELQAEDRDVAAVGEGKTNVANSPGARENGGRRDSAPRAATRRKRARLRQVPVEDRMNLLRRRHVGGGDGVVAKLCNAKRPCGCAVVDDDCVNGVGSVGLACGGDGLDR